MNRESDPAVESWLADVFAEARDELEPLPAEAVDAVIQRLDLRRHRRKWSNLRLGFVLGLTALIAVGATYASYQTWGRTTVSPKQLRRQAHVTVGFLPLPGGRRQGDLLVVNLKPSPHTCVYRYWEGYLIAASYQPPSGIHVPKYRIMVGCDGSSRGSRETTDPVPPTPTISVATHKILAGLKAQGLTPRKLTFIRTQPGHLAVAVTAQTNDPQRYPLVYRGDTSLAVFGDPLRYDGTDLRLVDSHQRTVWETAWSTRLRAGVGGPGRDYP